MSHPKEKRLVVEAHVYGPGKTHAWVYSREAKEWHTGCRAPGSPQPYGMVTDDLDGNPITCMAFGCGKTPGLPKT